MSELIERWHALLSCKRIPAGPRPVAGPPWARSVATQLTGDKTEAYRIFALTSEAELSRRGIGLTKAGNRPE